MKNVEKTYVYREIRRVESRTRQSAMLVTKKKDIDYPYKGKEEEKAEQ